jgi:hypothetical protein
MRKDSVRVMLHKDMLATIAAVMLENGVIR